jgi:hypothetical protein
MSKRKKRSSVSDPLQKPKQILLDESFLLCASGKGCDSTKCQDEADRRKYRALAALLMAQESEVLLVIDDQLPSQVVSFYQRKYQYLSVEVREILLEWLNKRTLKRKHAKINSKAIKDCNLKIGTLDPLLCQLAIACRGTPIWTLDSDFWCAIQFYPDIKPTCPKEALDSVT